MPSQAPAAARAPTTSTSPKARDESRFAAASPASAAAAATGITSFGNSGSKAAATSVIASASAAAAMPMPVTLRRPASASPPSSCGSTPWLNIENTPIATKARPCHRVGMPCPRIKPIVTMRGVPDDRVPAGLPQKR